MNVQERNEKLAGFFGECQGILEKKGKDYNPDGTAFGEWDKQAEATGLMWRQVVLVLMWKHWSAVVSFMKGGRLESEPIRERLKDLANYCALVAVKLEADEKAKGGEAL